MFDLKTDNNIESLFHFICIYIGRCQILTYHLHTVNKIWNKHLNSSLLKRIMPLSGLRVLSTIWSPIFANEQFLVYSDPTGQYRIGLDKKNVIPFSLCGTRDIPTGFLETKEERMLLFVNQESQLRLFPGDELFYCDRSTKSLKEKWCFLQSLSGKCGDKIFSYSDHVYVFRAKLNEIRQYYFKNNKLCMEKYRIDLPYDSQNLVQQFIVCFPYFYLAQPEDESIWMWDTKRKVVFLKLKRVRQYFCFDFLRFTNQNCYLIFRSFERDLFYERIDPTCDSISSDMRLLGQIAEIFQPELLNKGAVCIQDQLFVCFENLETEVFEIVHARLI